MAYLRAMRYQNYSDAGGSPRRLPPHWQATVSRTRALFNDATHPHSSDVRDYAFTAPGVVAAAGGAGAPRLVANAAHKTKVLTTYEHGPVGFLQWLFVAHPRLFHTLKAKRPDLLMQASVLNQKLKSAQLPLCPGLSGLGDVGLGAEIGSWAGTIASVVGDLGSVYNDYRSIKSPGGTSTAAAVTQNAANAAAGQQPYSYPTSSGSTVSTTAPPSSAVTTTSSIFSGSTGIMVIGGVAIVGVIAFFGLRKKR